MYEIRKTIKLEEVKPGQIIKLDSSVDSYYLVIKPRKGKIRFVPIELFKAETELPKKSSITDVYNSRDGILLVHKQ